MGEYCQRFEQEFAQFQDTAHCTLFNSGASANLAMLQALKNLGRLKSGDHIAYSALTWSTNVMPIVQLGMILVAVDCELENLNVSGDKIEALIKRQNIKAFFLTNVLGFVADIDKLRSICDAYNVLLIEDNCESLGTVYQGEKTGNFGLAASFSFYVAHRMSTIEGGMVCTKDSDLDEMLKIVRANGWGRNLAAEAQNKWRSRFDIDEFQSKYAFFDLGYNLRPTEVTGFLGCHQLSFLEETIQTRQQNYLNVYGAIQKNEELIALDHGHIELLSTFAVPIICKSSSIREKYLSRFQKAEIEVRPIISGNMQKQPFYDKYVTSKEHLPNTDHIHACGFYCGNYPELTDEDLALITDCLA